MIPLKTQSLFRPSTRRYFITIIGVLILVCFLCFIKETGIRHLKWQVGPKGYFNGTAADDSFMLEHIRTLKLTPPSTEPYNLTKPITYDTSGYGRAPVLDKLLNNMTGGFFVEAGAYDGERMSNTLHFEHYFGWSGLLIEANPLLFHQLQTKHRRAYTIHSCLSLHPVAEMVRFDFPANALLGRINDKKKEGDLNQCFPLYSLLLALDRTRVDFFSLDIEGDELKVLKTIPWDKVQIGLIEVEVQHVHEGRKAVRHYMESVGFTFVQDINLDSIFISKKVFK
ncbi:hypothetical protein SK128_020167, partial [Halocaridina rubra]